MCYALKDTSPCHNWARNYYYTCYRHQTYFDSVDRWFYNIIYMQPTRTTENHFKNVIEEGIVKLTPQHLMDLSDSIEHSYLYSIAIKYTDIAPNTNVPVLMRCFRNLYPRIHMWMQTFDYLPGITKESSMNLLSKFYDDRIQHLIRSNPVSLFASLILSTTEIDYPNRESQRNLWAGLIEKWIEINKHHSEFQSYIWDSSTERIMNLLVELPEINPTKIILRERLITALVEIKTERLLLIKNRCNIYKENLMEVAWHSSRLSKWCIDEYEKLNY